MIFLSDLFYFSCYSVLAATSRDTLLGVGEGQVELPDGKAGGGLGGCWKMFLN